MEEHELHQMLGNMEAKIDRLLDATREGNNKLRTVENRVDILEQSVTWVKGAVATAGFGLTAFGGMLGYILHQLGLLP